MNENTIVETERLVLRRWHESDAEALYKYASDGRVSEMAMWPRHTSIDMSRMVISEFFIPNPYNFAIILKSSNEPIGCIGLVPAGDEHYTLADNEREVGYWIGYSYWKMGMTTEALTALIEWCDKNLHLDSLLITTDANNIASQRVAEKCGFIHICDMDHEGIPIKAFRLNLAASRLQIHRIANDKHQYMNLLLIGDESETMIRKYLDRGNLFVGKVDGEAVAVIVSTEELDGSIEIKNLAVAPRCRRKGIGRRMLEHIEKLYRDRTICLGTGETPSTLRFYRSCGYHYSHRIPDFFIDNYPNPIIEEGVKLRDMIYLYKRLCKD